MAFILVVTLGPSFVLLIALLILSVQVPETSSQPCLLELQNLVILLQMEVWFDVS